MRRREFIRTCFNTCASSVAAATANPSLIRADPNLYRGYANVLLVHSNGEPVKPADLAVGTNYVFGYPFTETPCFLIDLGRPTQPLASGHQSSNGDYAWPGGVGENKSIVSYSAICTHKLSHPARSVSFISYRHQSMSYVDKNDESTVDKNGIIFCCSERSAYDPANGGRVLGGPAPLPLAAVDIVVNDDDKIVARGTFGADVFDRFFEAFGPRFALEFGSDEFVIPVEDSAIVTTLDDYSDTMQMC